MLARLATVWRCASVKLERVRSICLFFLLFVVILLLSNMQKGPNYDGICLDKTMSNAPWAEHWMQCTHGN